VDLGNLEFQANESASARLHFETALRLDANFYPAHQGLAGCSARRGARGRGRALSEGIRRKRPGVDAFPGPGNAVRVLLLVSTGYGNVSTREFLDSRIFEMWVLYVEHYDATQALPPHDVVFNAIGMRTFVQTACTQRSRSCVARALRSSMRRRRCSRAAGQLMRGAWER